MVNLILNFFLKLFNLLFNLGGSRLNSQLSKNDALKKFKKIFFERVGFSWENRKTSEKQPNKYHLLEIEKCYQDKDVNYFLKYLFFIKYSHRNFI